jgi:hypothetical protein
MHVSLKAPLAMKERCSTTAPQIPAHPFIRAPVSMQFHRGVFTSLLPRQLAQLDHHSIPTTDRRHVHIVRTTCAASPEKSA